MQSSFSVLLAHSGRKNSATVSSQMNIQISKTQKCVCVGTDVKKLEVTSHGILVASASLEISIEALQYVQELYDVLHAKGLTAVNSEGLGSADGVLDLATVEVVFGERIVVLLRDFRRRDILEGLHAINEDLEDGLLRLGTELVVSKGYVYSGLERVVERLY